MSYYEKIVQQIKDKVSENSYPPTFERKLLDLSVRNCYAYALDLDISDPQKRVFFPGCISSEEEKLDIFSGLDLLERLKKDLTFLGFSFRTNDQNLKEGEYRIAIYGLPTLHDMPIGFHISRQDKDGYWSEKRNWKSKPEKLDYSDFEAPKLVGVTPFRTEVLIIKRIQT